MRIPATRMLPCLLFGMLAIITHGHVAPYSEVSADIAHIRHRLEASEKAGKKDLQLLELRHLRDLQVQHGSIDSALASCLRVVDLSGLSDDRRAMALDWKILSEVTKQAGDLPQAIEAGKRFLLITRSTGDAGLKHEADLHLLDLLIAAGRYDEFRLQSEHVLQDCQAHDDGLCQARLLYRQGEVLLVQGRAMDALSLLHAAMRFADRLPAPEEVARIWFDLARANVAISQWETAFSAYRSGLELSPEAPRSAPELFGLLAQIHEGLGHLDEALQNERLRSRVKDSLITAEVAERTARLQTLYGIRMHNNDVASLEEAHQEASQALLHARTRLRWALIAAVAFAIGFILLSIVHMREARPPAKAPAEAPRPQDLAPVEALPSAPAVRSPQPDNIGLVELLVDTLYEQVGDLDEHRALREIGTRVRIMGLMQRNIHKSGVLGGINLRAHFTSLVHSLLEEHGLAGKAELRLNLGEIGQMTHGELLSLSLLVSELMRGSLQQARQPADVHLIDLGLYRVGSDQLELLYTDNRPIVQAHALNNGSICGSLARVWASALQGSIRLLKGETTTIQFTFRPASTETLRQAS